MKHLFFKDPKGKMSSMVRNCVDKPIFINNIIEDPKYRTYYKACRQELCNVGNGHSDTANTQIGSLGDKSTIYCPGVSTDEATKTTVSIVTISIFAALTYILVWVLLTEIFLTVVEISPKFTSWFQYYIIFISA